MMEKDEYDTGIPGVEQARLDEALHVLKRIEAVDKKKGYARLVQPLRQRERRLRVWRRIAVCAAVMFPLAVGILWLSKIPSTEILPLVKTDSIVPGGNRARLILADKSEIFLDTVITRDIVELAGVSVRKEGKGVVYESRQQAKEDKIAYNELVVPRGGEYDIILEDGTHVWLNAESRLKYPAVFTGKERRVYLEGEGYFDVARDTAKPFFVETREQSVRVLGTAFNIYAYTSERVNYATLVRGQVLVEDKRTGADRVLRPGEQVCLNATDGGAVVREVDVRKEIAWKDGLFVFNGQTLEQIMRKLARWYNITVFYRNEEAKDMLFKGNLPRYSDFRTVLSVLEKSSNVKFSVQDRVVMISI